MAIVRSRSSMLARVVRFSGAVIASYLLATILARLGTRVSSASEIVIDPTVTIDATSMSSVEAGKYKIGGKENISTASQVDSERRQIAEYDGPVHITLDYTVTKDDDGTVDLAKSSIRMAVLNYTRNGRTTPSNF